MIDRAYTMVGFRAAAPPQPAGKKKMSTPMAEMTAPAHADTLLPFAEADPAASADTLRAMMAEQGYLFFRRLVPAKDVLAVRQAVLELCQAAGWLDDSRELLDAVVAADMQPTTEGQPAYMAVYRKIDGCEAPLTMVDYRNPRRR